MDYLSLISQGLLLGAFLAILTGPIFVTLVQIAFEKGFRAGVVACTGEWISDIIIISAGYFFIQRVSGIVEDPAFTFWMGLFGGFILITFGAGTLLKKAKVVFEKSSHTANEYLGFWTVGFLVNTINPFTFLFWLSIISTKVIKFQLSGTKAFVFFSSIMFVIIVADIIKMYLAKTIRTKLNQKHFTMMSRLAGIGLIVLGIGLLVRSQVL